MSAASQYYKVTSRVGVPHRHEVEVTVPLVGPVGPAGPAGTGLETLQVQGDTLYRGASAGERLAIGSAGQVLKVSAQGLPTWANESGAVTSVNGLTGAVTVASDFGATPRILIGNNTLNGQLGDPAGFSSPYTSYTIPAPTRFGSQQNGIVRIWVDRPGAAANLTLNLRTTQVENGDLVEIYNLVTLPSYKVIVNTQGFGSFDLFPRQNAVFAYQASGGPRRWIKTFDNNFSTTLPTNPGDSLGVIGDMAVSSTHLYVKVPTNESPGASGWRRVPWATWTT